jgi:hypothetical protein
MFLSHYDISILGETEESRLQTPINKDIKFLHVRKNILDGTKHYFQFTKPRSLSGVLS